MRVCYRRYDDPDGHYTCCRPECSVWVDNDRHWDGSEWSGESGSFGLSHFGSSQITLNLQLATN